VGRSKTNSLKGFIIHERTIKSGYFFSNEYYSNKIFDIFKGENMKINVLIPSKSIVHNIAREIVNNDIDVTIGDDFENEIVKMVKDKFERKFKENQILVEDVLKNYDVINIELMDNFAEKSNMIAAFNIYRSNVAGEVYFAVSSHMIFNELLEKHNINDLKYKLSCDGYWSHELLHLADWNLLYRRNKLLSKKIGDDTVPKTLDFSSLIRKKEQPFVREWEVLWTLANFRDEGLAVLYEYLSGERDIQVDPKDAQVFFVNHFNIVLKESRRELHFFDPCSETYPYEKYHEFLNKFKERAYGIGMFMVMDAISSFVSRSPEYYCEERKIIKDIISKMTEKKPPGIDKNIAMKIAKIGLSLNMSTFIESLSNEQVNHPWGAFLNIHQISEVFNFISYSGKEGYEDFFEKIYLSLFHYDKKLFCDTIEDIIGKPMSVQEINMEKNKIKDFKNMPSSKEIECRLKELHNYLSKDLNDEDMRLLLLALTYFYDPEDYIRDDIPFIGLLDDLHVLRIASILLRIKL
jgi:uncharacterized membrane protein YkvA (DUF1232 family)/cupin superfamily acireductone dioxygenase involved in methionine salvage